MAKSRKDFSLTAMLDSDEDQYSDDNMMPTPDESALENVAPPPKARGKAKAPASKVTKPKATTRRTSASGRATKKVASTSKTAAGKRTALREQTNGQQASDTEEVENFDELDDDRHKRAEGAVDGTAFADELDTSVEMAQPKKRGRTAKSRTDTVATSRATVQQPVKPQSKATKATRQPASKQRAAAPVTNDDAEPSGMDVDASAMLDVEAAEEPTTRAIPRHTSRARSVSRSRQPTATRNRGGSASDADRPAMANDPALRRKLGEVTKKLEMLDLKYRNLREVGVKEAEANFEKLRKRSEEKNEAAKKLIASLKSEVSSKNGLAEESTSLRDQLASKDAEIASLRASLSEAQSSLSNYRNENKTLSAKLADHRAASQATDGSKTIRNGQRAEPAQAAVAAKLTEELFCDLTGLMLRGVERKPEVDVFDCLQTGRNGTLRFKLAVATQGNYDETEFVFTPIFDDKHDAELIELLPDYLTEEITFARRNAGKFYARVLESLTRRIDPES